MNVWARLALTLCLSACGRVAPGTPQPDALGIPTKTPTTTAAELRSLPKARLEDSLYQVHLALLGQDGAAFGLDVEKGHPVLVSMFYGQCKYACPLLVSNIRAIESALSEAERGNLRVLLVSFDAEHDTPSALTAFAGSHHLGSSFRLAAAADEDARTLAALLGIQYRRMPNGSFAHNSVLGLLDRDGVLVATTDKLDPPAPEFIEQLHGALGGVGQGAEVAVPTPR